VVLQSLRNRTNEVRVVAGSGHELPKTSVLEFSLTADDWNEISYAGPHAYAAALEILNRGDLSEQNSWMRREALEALQSQSFQSSSGFDLEATRQKMKEASRGETIPNPEHSTDWMHLFAGALTLNPFVQGGRAKSGACQKCGVPEERLRESTLKACKRRMNVFYCSRKCQQEDRKQHKKVCLSKDKK